MTDPTDELERELERMIESQRTRVLELANRLRPGTTADDMTQPHDYEELSTNWHWNYEDGFLAGLVAAQLTLRRVVRK